MTAEFTYKNPRVQIAVSTLHNVLKQLNKILENPLLPQPVHQKLKILAEETSDQLEGLQVDRGGWEVKTGGVRVGYVFVEESTGVEHWRIRKDADPLSRNSVHNLVSNSTHVSAEDIRCKACQDPIFSNLGGHVYYRLVPTREASPSCTGCVGVTDRTEPRSQEAHDPEGVPLNPRVRASRAALQRACEGLKTLRDTMPSSEESSSLLNAIRDDVQAAYGLQQIDRGGWEIRENANAEAAVLAYAHVNDVGVEHWYLWAPSGRLEQPHFTDRSALSHEQIREIVGTAPYQYVVALASPPEPHNPRGNGRDDQEQRTRKKPRAQRKQKA